MEYMEMKINSESICLQKQRMKFNVNLINEKTK